MIKVLIVEDSPVVANFLKYIFESEPDMAVVGMVPDGHEALEAVRRTNPQVVTMDIHMPKMNGFDATRAIMETHPTPIVVVSGSSTAEEVATTFRAIEAGALAVVGRPRGAGHPEFERSARELVQTVRLMAEVKVVRRWPRRSAETPSVQVRPRLDATSEIRVIAIGASTGGPVVLETILRKLPKPFPVPLVVVQHMAAGFVQGLAEWLTQSTGFSVRVAGHREQLMPGTVYVAPDNHHMGVGPDCRAMLGKEPPENGLRPSISYLFRSVAQAFGKNSVGVLLTGMGKDGAEELKLIKDQGAITFAQDANTSVVFGMPGEAIERGAVSYVLPPEKIAEALVTLASSKK